MANQIALDGDARPFTSDLYTSLRGAAFFFGGVCMASGVLILAKRQAAQSWVSQADLRFSARLILLRADFRVFFHSFSLFWADKKECLLAVALLLPACWLRLYNLSGRMNYDEAYTYVAFASKSFWTVLSDYHLPNNHVFHTILVFLSTRLFGNQPWAVRIPVLIAGILVVFAVYLIARRLYSIPVALISACFAAQSDLLIGYSNNARGYMVLTLFALLAFWAGAYLLDHRNRFVWILFVVFLSLGFFTLPIMIYPAGAIFLWMLVSGLVGNKMSDYPTRKVFFRYWFIAGLATALLTGLLYTPILTVSGPEAFFGNKFVQPLPWHEFLNHHVAGWMNTWDAWWTGLPSWFGILVMIGSGLSLVFHQQISRYRVPTQIPTLIWIVLALIVQKPDHQAKVWVFLLPWVMIWASAGWTGLIQFVARPFRFQNRIALGLSGLLLLGLYLFTLQKTTHLLPTFELDHSDVQATAQHLSDVIRPGDMIVIASPVDAPLQYYALYYGISPSAYYLPKQNKRPFTRAFIVVSPAFGQTIQSVLDDRKLDSTWFDLDHRHTESDFGVYIVYRVNPANTP
ncbi:MAG TPA: glycosyltransferase family 39 protein [Anaerolineaceae bacterium]|nr:glycosyltransferase family 39 protein [Anaerolineaceae bacterium]